MTGVSGKDVSPGIFIGSRADLSLKGSNSGAVAWFVILKNCSPHGCLLWEQRSCEWETSLDLIIREDVSALLGLVLVVVGAGFYWKCLLS